MRNVLSMHGNLRVDINDIINEQNNKLRFNDPDYLIILDGLHILYKISWLKYSYFQMSSTRDIHNCFSLAEQCD